MTSRARAGLGTVTRAPATIITVVTGVCITASSAPDEENHHTTATTAISTADCLLGMSTLAPAPAHYTPLHASSFRIRSFSVRPSTVSYLELQHLHCS